MGINKMLRKIVILSIIMIISYSVYGQNSSASDFYYDFQVHYPPTYENSMVFKKYHLSNFNACINLEEVFEYLFKYLFNQEFKVIRKPGMTTFRSALPADMFTTTKLKVEFDDEGKVHGCLIYGKKLLEDNQIEEFNEAIRKIKFRPALKNNKGVRVILFYYVEKK